jgi:hypothetical protein
MALVYSKKKQTDVELISECKDWKLQLRTLGIEDSDIRKLEEFNRKVIKAMT